MSYTCSNIVSAFADENSMELLLDYVASQLGREVHRLATELGVEENQVYKLEMEYSCSTHEQIFHILYKWLTSNAGLDYIQVLIEALKSIERNDIREKVQAFKKDNYRYDLAGVDGSAVLNDNDKDKVASELAANSYRLARFLGIPQSAISRIEKDNARNITSQTLRMLSSSGEHRKKKVTRQELCDGLLYIGQSNVVENLQMKWRCK